MARRNKAGDHSYTRTAKVRGREDEGRWAVLQKDAVRSRVARRRPDGSAIGDGELVLTDDLIDLKLTQIVPTGQRGTVTLPGDFREQLGIKEGTPLEMIIEEDGWLSVRPLSRVIDRGREASLDDLLDRITPENLHSEVDAGPSIGRESW